MRAIERILRYLAYSFGLVMLISFAAAAPAPTASAGKAGGATANAGTQSALPSYSNWFWKDVIGWPYNHPFDNWSAWMDRQERRSETIAKRESDNIGFMPASQLERNLKSRWGGIVVDVGAKAVFQESHIPGAVNIPVKQLADLAPKMIPNRNTPIVAYCGTTGCNAAISAARELRKLGYKNVYDFWGNLSTWTAMGYPTVSAEVAHK